MASLHKETRRPAKAARSYSLIAMDWTEYGYHEHSDG